MQHIIIIITVIITNITVINIIIVIININRDLKKGTSWHENVERCVNIHIWLFCDYSGNRGTGGGADYF